MSQAMNGLLAGLGKGIADVGTTAFNAQIEQARELRLRQYQTEDHARDRGEKLEDYKTARTDEAADHTRDRAELTGDRKDERTYQEGVTKEQHSFQSGLVDKQQGNAVANAKTQHDWDMEAATAAAGAAAEQFEREGTRVQSVKVLEESVTDPDTGITTKTPTGKVLYTFDNGNSQELDLRSGTTTPHQLNPEIAAQMEKQLTKPAAPAPAQPAAPTYGAKPLQGAGLLSWKPQQ